MKTNYHAIITLPWTSPPNQKSFMSWFKLYYKKMQDDIEKKLHSSLKQCHVKANKKTHSVVSIFLYSINQFYLIKEINYSDKIYLTKNKT